MSIVDTPKNDVSNTDRKLYKRKICTSSIKSSSTLLYFSTRAIHNRVHYDQNKHLTLKSYIPGINTSISPKKYDENIFSKKKGKKLHAWIDNNPHV